MITRVVLTRVARKQLRKAPRHIVENLAAWVDDVETQGLQEARRIPGYHDETLLGDRQGQRSIRLSRTYRAVYTIGRDAYGEFVSVEEIMKHAY